MKNKLKFVLFFVLFSTLTFANVSLPSVFASNMVLQRNTEVTIWGWASPGEEVVLTPSWNAIAYKIKTGNQAKWEIKVPTPKEGGPYTIKIKGYNELVLENILIGEVWLCSGQSNMEMSASWGIKEGDLEVEKANIPSIRFFTVPKTTAIYPQNNVTANWQECRPETMKYSSAVAYFFAKRLQEKLNGIPVGLIVSAWGGTPAEIWTPESTIRQDPTLLAAAEKLKEQSYGPREPARAYNAMIHPLVGYKIAGALWYQGESNVGSNVYNKTMAALIASWRTLWKTDFPFYLVQIAPYNYGEDHFSGVIIRDSQRKLVNEVTKTGMVVISDVSPIDDIHPKDKKPVGERLANLALSQTYNQASIPTFGPVYKGFKIEKDKILVQFDNNEGLYFKNKTTNLFEIAAADGVFYSANASIVGKEIKLSSTQVKDPKKVRFAWKNNAQSELFNGDNLPASSFISE